MSQNIEFYNVYVNLRISKKKGPVPLKLVKCVLMVTLWVLHTHFESKYCSCDVYENLKCFIDDFQGSMYPFGVEILNFVMFVTF